MKKLILFSLLLSAALWAAPSDHDNTVVVPSLKGLVFVSAAQDVQKSGITSEGISLSAVPMLTQGSFKDDVASYLGKPLTFKGLNEITAKVSSFFKDQHHPVVDVVAPEQDVTTGVIQIVVNEFKVGEVRVQGNRYFSDNIITAPIHFAHGDTIDSAKLLSEITAANSNPFRRVDLMYQPSSQPGYADLVLNTQDRLPINVYAGFDNSGTPSTGRSRWNMGATWGNALWHDQQLSYQFSASDNFFSRNGPSNFIGHGLSWSIPVRANDSVTIFGSYQRAIPNIGSDFGYLGKSGQASIRYNLGLHRTSRFIQTLSFGYDFKTTNNNLEFGGTQVSRNSTEIDQFPIAYAANLTDKWGSSSLTTSLIFSPGGMTPNNHSSDFQPTTGQTGIDGAMSRYTYWRTDFNRLNKVPGKMVYAFRLMGQVSSTNLLYTEKLLGGGPDILRGYDPNSVLGDRGFIMSNELRSPAWKPSAEYNLGQLQFVAFWDYAHLMATHAFPGYVNSLSASSVGTGARYNFRSNLTGHFDYGWQLIHLPNTNSEARSHLASIALTMAY